MRKYKPRIDIRKFGIEYHTISPIELARIIQREKHVKRTPDAIGKWFKRHPEDRNEILKAIGGSFEKRKEVPDVYAKLSTYNYGSIEIIDLDTLKEAREKLAVIEEELKKDICEKANLTVFSKVSHDR